MGTRSRCGIAIALMLFARAPSVAADPTDSLPEACDGLLGLSFSPDVRVWDGTDEQAGFVDFGGGSVHWADNWWPGQDVPGTTDEVALGIHPCLQGSGTQLLAFGDFAGLQDPVPSPGAELITKSLTVYGGRFDLDLGDQSYTAIARPGVLRVGVTSPYGASEAPADLRFLGGGSFDTRNPGFSDVRAAIGDSEPGSLTASGAGTTLILPDFVDIGLGSTGSLRVEDGARVEVSTESSGGRLNLGGAGADVVVTGPDTSLSASSVDVGGRFSGNPGPAALTIEQGALAEIHGGIFTVTPTGVLTVRDAGTRLQMNNSVSVEGSVRVEGGARFEAGLTTSGDATVRGAGTSLIAPNSSGVTVFGPGLLRIEDGAFVRATTRVEDGSIVVSGAGSELRGTLSLGFEGRPEAAALARIETGAVYRGSSLRLTTEDSVFELAGGAAALGTAAQNGAGTLVPGELHVESLTGPGLGGFGTIVADVVANGSAIQPGLNRGVGTLRTIGTLSITGDLTLRPMSPPASDPNRLVIDLAPSNGAAVNDRLSVSGHVDLGGAVLETSFLGSLAELDAAVAPEDQFVALEAGDAIEGALRLATGAMLESGDLLPILAEFGPFPRGPRYFQVFYGSGSPFGANRIVFTGFSAVPEPGTLLLTGAGAALLGASRRRRRGRGACR